MGINKSYLKDKFLSTKGYKRNSPDVNNPYNVIPSNQITMKGVDFPVMGTDNMGYQQMMYPGQDYTFPGDYVTEFPLKNMGNKRYGQKGFYKSNYQEGGPIPIEDPYADYEKMPIMDDSEYQSYIKKGKGHLISKAIIPEGKDPKNYAKYLIRESDEEYNDRKKEQREYLEKQRAKKLAARNPTNEELDILNTYIKNYNDPNFIYGDDYDTKTFAYDKLLNILNNTNVLPIGNFKNKELYNIPDFDYSKPGFMTDKQAESEYGKYCPECFASGWYYNIYPKPKQPQFNIKGIIADQYVPDSKNPSSLDYRYRINTDKGFDVIKGKQAFEEWKQKNATEYQPYYQNPTHAPIDYNKGRINEYLETPTLKYQGGGKKRSYKPDFRSKSQIAASQGNTGDSTKVAPRINPVDIRKGKEAGLQSAIANQPAFNQGYQKTGFDIERSDYYRKQKELKDALKNVDVVTDVMQLGNFIPLPHAQIIGKVGNWLGAATDVTQAGMDYGDGNYGSMGINLASAMVPTALGAASFRRNSKYLRPGQPLYPFSPQARMSNLGPNVINLRTSRVNYIEPFTKVRGMTDKNLLANRALLGTLGAETAYDAGAFDNSTRLGLPIKPININKPNYQGGGTNDSEYMNFVRTLPPNLAQPNDPSYNLKGYWEASGSPKSFDYNQPTDPQGYYHAFSRNPRTGQILKAPFHPSFKEGVSDKGAYKLVNPRGDVYTQGFKYPAYEGYYGLPKNAIIDNNYDFLDKPNYEGYFQMGGTMSVPGVNGQVVSSGPQPLTSVKKTRGPITKNKKGDIKTMSNQQVKQVLKYSKQKPNKI